MARFVRDEKKTFPFTWLIIGGLFAFSTVWAVYAELVTRVPWQAHQQAFFELELRLATESFEAEKARWEKISNEEPLKGQLARAAELEAEMKSGEYATAKAKLDQLDLDFANAEVGKTFGGSDLDEAYYYRNLAEYERDAAQVEVRKLYKAHYGETDPDRAKNEPDSIYVDPAAPAREEGESKESHHLRTEVARMTAHRDKLREAMKNNHPADLTAALEHAAVAEQGVIDALAVEQKHQARIDDALVKMAAIDGPSEPRVAERDPKKLDTARQAARAEVCKGKEETRNCIKWLQLGPKDKELKTLTIAISKAKRPLDDAKLRLAKAKDRAEPEFDPENPMKALVGPYQIQQIVTSWMDYERDVDIEQVDRCNTCHMGVNSNAYDAPDIDYVFRTHPRRDAMMKSHPIDKFGCTVCHQGQGRATDKLAHSMWELEVKHGHERWHYTGDHYWEDPLLPAGLMTKIIIDDQNDVFEVKLGRAKPATIALEHRDTQATVDEDESPESRLLQELQTKLQAVVDADEKLKAVYRAVARKIDNRISIGYEMLPGAEVPKKGPPKVEINFVKAELASMLGFGTQLSLAKKGETLFTAKGPPVVPIRAAHPKAQGQTYAYETKKNGKVEATYAYVPPDGAHGLQVPDDMRSRLIRGLPEIEAGCLRCHSKDADLVPFRSDALAVQSKMAYLEAEAEQNADPAAYREAHGTDELPQVKDSSRDILAETGSLAPTLDEGRQLFRQLNCTGCHLLSGFENNPDQGPQLDDISAKVTPEWLLKWLRHPRGWRAKTSMPNLWPRPLEPASKLPYAEGTPEYEKWVKERTEETIAVAAYLWDRSENPANRPNGGGSATKPLREKIKGAAEVEGASAELGQEIFEAYGCQGCHAVTEGEDLPAEWKARERDLAPTLSNLKDKVASADWVAFWVKNPSAYWHGTSMPNLRLNDVEAASVAKYLVSLSAKPPAPAKVTADEVKKFTDPKLREEEMVCELAGGVKMSRVECGGKIIEKRGCYGCHSISGYDKFAPIGPELSGFAKKDITTLDYGYAIADHHMQTTETFAALKLDAPRIFARDRIQLFMGDFDMSAREIRAVTLFLKGVVPASPNTEFDPLEQENHAAVVRGRQLVNDLNCRGCHVIEGRGGEIDGWRAAILASDPQRRAPFLDAEGARVQPEWLFSFLRDPQENGIRPWLHPEWVWGDEVPKKKRAIRMPTFNLTAEEWTDIVRYFASWDHQPYPYQVPKVRELDSQEKLWAISNVNNTGTGNCLSCHYFGEFPVDRGKADLKKMAPNIDVMRRRLRPEWVKSWLLMPANYLPYTAMTAFWATKNRPKDEGRFRGDFDPFISPKPPGWENVIPNFREVDNEEQAELMRDFLFSIPDGVTKWPKKGEEATSVLVDPEAASKLAAESGEGEGEAEGGVEPAPEPPENKPDEAPGG